MGIFDFFKGKSNKPEETKEKYWSLTTIMEEILNPTNEQIENAVKNATPDQTSFATLAHKNSGHEIESVQAISEDGFYRFEALTKESLIYVKSDLTYKETLELFLHFFNYQRVSGVESWPSEKY